MEYFFYCRDRPGTAELRDEIVEAHWSFMDAYADAMIARGPTMSDDRESATGSVHIVDLPDAEAARVFAYEEPNYLAGVYLEVMTRRFHDELGRTMWEFAGDPAGAPRFLVIGHGAAGVGADTDDLRDEQRRDLVDRGYHDHLIAHGPLLSEDGTGWAGSALLVELADREAVEEMVAGDPFARAGLYGSVEVHPWQFGGRPEAGS
jgi:uncharacterized protein YciI